LGLDPCRVPYVALIITIITAAARRSWRDFGFAAPALVKLSAELVELLKQLIIGESALAELLKQLIVAKRTLVD
jgi:hypothetical protein